MNANNLRNQLLTLLHLLPTNAETNFKDLEAALPNYSSSFNPEKLRDWLYRYKEVGLGDFSEILPDPNTPFEKWQYGEALGNFYTNSFSHYNLQYIRDAINKFQNRAVPAPYEFIVVKMLYGTAEYKKEYDEAIHQMAEEEGRRFDDLISPFRSKITVDEEFDF